MHSPRLRCIVLLFIRNMCIVECQNDFPFTVSYSNKNFYNSFSTCLVNDVKKNMTSIYSFHLNDPLISLFDGKRYLHFFLFEFNKSLNRESNACFSHESNVKQNRLKSAKNCLCISITRLNYIFLN